ncbi:hypothetical protein HBA_0606 [Sodalis endosymbiont of Henestaris halophilus]|nr:hypothetical protein HBA_0606 [Sodalis endosymbiont of Henestaris halophilus]
MKEYYSHLGVIISLLLFFQHFIALYIKVVIIHYNLFFVRSPHDINEA